MDLSGATLSKIIQRNWRTRSLEGPDGAGKTPQKKRVGAANVAFSGCQHYQHCQQISWYHFQIAYSSNYCGIIPLFSPIWSHLAGTKSHQTGVDMLVPKNAAEKGDIAERGLGFDSHLMGWTTSTRGSQFPSESGS